MRHLRLAVLLAPLLLVVAARDSAAQKTAVEPTGTATIQGRVVYDGAPPAGANLAAQVAAHADAKVCHADPTKDSFTDLTWVVGKDGGVANVVVWVRPPVNKFFKKPPDSQKTWKDEVAVDQPYCAFTPHVTVLYSEAWDETAKKLVPTGQKFKFMNSAPVAHNTAWAGNPVKGIAGNITLPSKAERVEHLKSDFTTVIDVHCDFHKWMRSYIWSLETPYAAVTDKDGRFEIKNVPAGAEVQIVAWHEQPGFLNGGPQGEKLTLKPGETLPKDFKAKEKK